MYKVSVTGEKKPRIVDSQTEAKKIFDNKCKALDRKAKEKGLPPGKYFGSSWDKSRTFRIKIDRTYVVRIEPYHPDPPMLKSKHSRRRAR